MLPPPPIAPLRLLLLPWLSRRLAEPLASGELGFLEGRNVNLALAGVPYQLALGLNNGRFELDWAEPPGEVVLEGNPGALLQMATGQADGDALFFQRQLNMEGDTELAMELKALLSNYRLLPEAPQRFWALKEKLNPLLPPVLR